MMFKRLIRAASSFHRIPEVLRAFSSFSHPLRNTAAYLQLVQRRYPFELAFRSKYHVRLDSWEDLTTAWVVFLGREYRILPTDRVIADLGANIGTFSLLARSINANARIIAVEPFPENYARLCECLKTNGLLGEVDLRSYAVSAHDGEVQFDANPSIASHSRKIAGEGATADHVVNVPSLSLRSFLDTEKIEVLDFLKMDIEGAEYGVILNADSDTLSRVRRIGLEYHSHGHQQLTDHLAKEGFRITYHPKSGSSGVIEYDRG